MLGRVRAAPGLQDELLSLHHVDARPRVPSEGSPELLEDEVEDRLWLAPAADDPAELLQDDVDVDLALLPRHHFAELPDSLHRTASAIERV